MPSPKKDTLNIFIQIDKRKIVQEYQKNKIPFSVSEENNFNPEKAFKLYSDFLSNKSLQERFEAVMNALGKNYLTQELYYYFIYLIELLPYVKNNIHLMIIGDKGTGKTGCMAYSDKNYMMSEMPTEAELRGSKNDSTKKPLLDYPILFLDEIGDYATNDSMGIIKSFETNNSYTNRENEKAISKCSIIKCGNNKGKIDNFKDLIAYNVLKGIPNIWKKEAILDRQTALLYHSDNLKLTDECFIQAGKEALNINILLNALAYAREKDEIRDSVKNIKIDSNISSRKNNIIKKSLSGLLDILYPDKEPEEYILTGLLDIILHFNLILENQHYSPFKIKNSKFLLELISPKELNIEDGYLLKNRILLHSGDCYYKIALTPFGVLENQRELELYKNFKNNNSIIVPLKEKNRTTLIQKYYPLISKNNHFDNNGNPIVFNYEAETFKQLYNEILIELLLERGKNNNFSTSKKFIDRTELSETTIEKIIKKSLSLPYEIKISKSCYSYDGKTDIKLINFGHLIKNSYIS
ncbi:BREX system Lon protease-like protein BrxL [Fusobacterium varium]|uniref:BREX system Lon protease-like protein BrxL n=1 Tax=Fusobacterium varium TaxID=856 RepID=UPI0032C0B18E